MSDSSREQPHLSKSSLELDPEKAKELELDISLQALAHKLLKQHLLHLELKQELARVNALGGGGDK